MASKNKKASNKDFLIRVPFSYRWLLSRVFSDDIKTILDVGCGDGNILAVTLPQHHGFEITGIDIHDESLQISRSRKVYQKLIKVDVTKKSWVGIDKKRYDLVFCSQLIEHINKRSGEQLLRKIDKMAKGKIVITTPNGYLKDRPLSKWEKANPHQEHQSGWTANDFEKFGYSVYGQGLGLIYRLYSSGKILPGSIWRILFGISYLLNPIMFLFPNLSFNLVAIKNIEKST